MAIIANWEFIDGFPECGYELANKDINDSKIIIQ